MVKTYLCPFDVVSSGPTNSIPTSSRGADTHIGVKIGPWFKKLTFQTGLDLKHVNDYIFKYKHKRVKFRMMFFLDKLTSCKIQGFIFRNAPPTPVAVRENKTLGKS